VQQLVHGRAEQRGADRSLAARPDDDQPRVVLLRQRVERLRGRLGDDDRLGRDAGAARALE
jgi:hypothetical protein